MKQPIPDCQTCPSRKNSLFRHCDLAELEQMAGAKCFNTYKKGQVIFHEGNRPFGLFCLFDGKVKVSRTGADGKEQIIRLARRGDTLGYRSLIENSKYTASAVALDDTQACFIPATDFNHLVDTNVRVAADLLHKLAQALGQTQDALVHLATKPVRERLAEALLLLKTTYQREGEALFSIAISREDLAALIGTAKETVIRVLSEFKDEGIVRAQGSLITVLKPDKLLKISSLYD
jgi:CRP-like cAMP-binding protein